VQTTLPDQGFVVSGTIDAFEGARAAVLAAEELFRVDVVVVPDNVRVIVRNLTDLPMVFEPDGYPRPVALQGSGDLSALGVRPGHHQLAFTLGDGAEALDVRVVLATLRRPEEGRVQITGQAVLRRQP
jgi:hypothetical protein